VIGHVCVLRYRLRIVVVALAIVSCAMPAGIHSARAGGSTQVPLSVATMRTPLDAQAS
jgi:hypothetical protein